MSEAIQLQQNRSNQQSFIITTVMLAALLITFLFIKLSHPVEQAAISGVMIDFGDNKDGLGDDNLKDAGGHNAAPQKVTAAPSVPTPPTPTPVKTVTTPVKAQPTNTVVSEDPQAVAIAKMQKEEKIKEQKALLEQQRIAELVKKAEQERLAREAEEAKIKGQVAGVFTKGKTGTGNGTGNSNGNGNGNGQGNTKPGGNQGAVWGKPGGDPNGNGTGPNGNGPGNGKGSYDMVGRTWHPNLPTNTTNKIGKVVVTIKIDRNGNVIFAQYQQKGSTTTDADLIRIAVDGAKKSSFSANADASEEQVGTVTYNFTN